MTESEWLGCTDPTPMVEFLGGRAGYRKTYLFACGCCRLIWNLLSDVRSRTAVEVTERFIDGLASEREMYRAKHGAVQAAEVGGEGSVAFIVWTITRPDELRAAWQAARIPATEEGVVASLIRCIIGNPFRHLTVDPSWLAWNDGMVVKLAQGIYDQRAFNRMPELADAVEAAGCTNADLLAHCRQPGEHVRGCWAVDLILGKE